LVSAIAGCSAQARCATPSDRATTVISLSDPAPVLALARGELDLGLVYVLRPPWPALAHFVFQRLTLEGALLGAPLILSPVDQSIPGTVSIAFDATGYLACTVIVGGASCFRVSADGTTSDDTMIVDATAIAIAHGGGGVMAAWIEGGALHAGPLGSSVSTIATTDAAPAITPNDHGYVIGYAAAGIAYAVSLDAAGHATHPVALGPALDSGRVAVAFAAGSIGASYVAPDGDAMVSVLTGSDLHTSVLGAGAMSLGQVAIAGASDGFFATWSDADGAIHGARVDRGAVATASYVHDVARPDATHALVETDAGFVLAANTTSAADPLHVVDVGCP
jgi:hypothetical protein